MFLSITYDNNFFFFKTKEELYKAMDRMDYGAFSFHQVENVSEAIAFYTLAVERDLTEEEIQTIKTEYMEEL